jgi:hypothetical protein
MFSITGIGGMLASHALSRLGMIPSGYSWYVWVIDDGWNDSVRQEFRDNIENLASAGNGHFLVINSLQPGSLANAVIDAYKIEGELQAPALVVTNLSVAEKNSVSKIGKSVTPEEKTITISLKPYSNKPGEITKLLIKLSNSLKEDDPQDSLENLDRSKIERRWGWLRSLELKPNFCGFGINFNEIIDELLKTSL